MKKCPYCAEEIQDEAIKCKHCGSNIINEVMPESSLASALNTSKLIIDHEQNWAVVAHLGGLIPMFFLSMIIPFLIWLMKGSESAFVEKQAKEALNFQISLNIYGVMAILIAFTIIGIPITILSFIFFWITNLICSITAAVKTSRKITYTYPLNLRLIQ